MAASLITGCLWLGTVGQLVATARKVGGYSLLDRVRITTGCNAVPGTMGILQTVSALRGTLLYLYTKDTYTQPYTTQYTDVLRVESVTGSDKLLSAMQAATRHTHLWGHSPQEPCQPGWLYRAGGRANSAVQGYVSHCGELFIEPVQGLLYEHKPMRGDVLIYERV